MWSLVPRPVRRYRREHPYSHPLLFFCVDILDSSLKFVLTCGVIYGIYIATTHRTNGNHTIVANPTTTIQHSAVDEQVVPDSNTETMLITASATSAPTGLTLANDKSSKANTLLEDDKAIRWVTGLPDSHYTIQFASSLDKDALIEFASTHLQKGAVIYPFKTTTGNNTMFGVASGLYESLHSALLAIDNMPKPLAQHGPWVRPISKLQKEVRDTASLAQSVRS